MSEPKDRYEGHSTPEQWGTLGEFDPMLGYDGMTSGIRFGPGYLDGTAYGESLRKELPPEGKARMLADARLLHDAPELLRQNRELRRALEACEDAMSDEGMRCFALRNARATLETCKEL